MVPGSPFAGVHGPVWLTVDTTGKFVYVANSSSNDVSEFTIAPGTGALVAAGLPFAAGTAPNSVTVDPTGKFASVSILLFKLACISIPGCCRSRITFR